MGFFNNLLNNLLEDTINKSVDYYRKKYEEMSIEKLKQEWNYVFSDRSKSNGLDYEDCSPNAILDEVYGRRVSYRNWRYIIQEYERGEKNKLKK